MISFIIFKYFQPQQRSSVIASYFFFFFSLVSKTAAEAASEYDSCAHRRCKRVRQLRAPSLLDSSGFVSLLLLPTPRQGVGLVLPSVYCSRTRCCAIRFVDDESRALVSFVSLVHTYVSTYTDHGSRLMPGTKNVLFTPVYEHMWHIIRTPPWHIRRYIYVSW